MKAVMTVCLAWLLVPVAPPPGVGQKAVEAVLLLAANRQPATAFRLRDAAGTTQALSDFRGQTVVLNLWATECGGCRRELPAFVQLHRTYGQRGLRVIGVSMDVAYEDLKTTAEAWSRVTPFARTHGLDYTILVDDGSLEKAYHVTNMPATYLIDRQGRLAATYIGVVDGDNLTTNVQTILAERDGR